MLDNKNKDLSEKGWKSMSSLLDVEMPVRKGKRRFLILLLFLSIGIAATGYYTLTEKTSTDEIIPNGPHVAEANLESNADLIIEEHSKSKTDEIEEILPQKKPTEFVEKISESRRQEPEAIKIKTQVTAMGNESQVTNNIVDRKIKENVQINNSDHKQDEIVLPALDLQTTSKQIVVDASSESMLASKVMVSSFDNLPIIDINAVNFDSRLLTTSPNLIAIPRKNTLFLRLYAGYAFPLFSNLNGPEFGVNVGKELNRRWELQIGGHLLLSNSQYSNFLSRDSDYLANEVSGSPVEVTDVDIEYGSIEELGQNEILEEYYDLVSQKITRLNFVNVPIQVNYKMTPKHHIGLGFQYSYLINGYNEEINLAELVSSLSNSNSFLGNSVLIDNNLLTRHNLGFKGQYRFEITKAIGINLTANYGVKKILKTDAKLDSQNRMAYLNLGIDYKL